jgi:hypothetical protein
MRPVLEPLTLEDLFHVTRIRVSLAEPLSDDPHPQHAIVGRRQREGQDLGE